MTMSRRVFLGSIPLAWPALANAPATLTCPLADAPTVLIPGVSNTVATRLIGSKLYRGLCQLDDRGAPKPDLAVSCAVDDTATRFTFSLAPGVTWHDAAPVTAEDVVFSFDQFHRALTPDLRLDRVASIKASDPLTVVMTLKQPDASFPAEVHALAAPIVPRHVHDRADWGLDPLRVAPIGAGPFRFSEWLRLVRFDWFAGPRPVLDAIDFPVVPPGADLTTLLQSGRPVLVVDAPEDAAAARLWDSKLLVVEGVYPPGARAVVELQVNAAAKPVDNPDVRSALAGAIDRGKLLWAVWSGLAREPAGPPYDPRAAADRLQAAGLLPGEDGVRARIPLLVPSDPALQRLAGMLVRMLRLVAIELVPETVDAQEWRRRVAAGAYSLAACLAEAGSAPGAIAIAEPAIPVLRDRRLVLPGGIYGSFADATLG